MAYELLTNLSNLLDIYGSKHFPPKEKDIRDAFAFADQHHNGMLRGTGEPFIHHSLRVATMVAEWGFDSDVITVALLHDVVEECGVPLSEIRKRFGKDVSAIIESTAKMSEKDFVSHPEQIPERLLSDEIFQEKMSEKALYVKIADRIDNLSTLSGINEESGILMAKHTRLVVVPLVRAAHAYRFADMLEDLCLRAEHPSMYEEISRIYKDLRTLNSRKTHESLSLLANVFDPHQNNETQDLARYHLFIESFRYDQRSCVSIYRQIAGIAENIKDDLRALLCKENIPLYDLTLIVSDSLEYDYSELRPNDIFFRYFEKSLSKKGFYLIRYGLTTYKDAGFFLISDEMDNLYRLFVRTGKGYQRFKFGNIVDEDDSLFREETPEIGPDETNAGRIKVYRKDGSSMQIRSGSTVLDFAFHIRKELGLHFEYALVNESESRLDKNTRLNDGDMVTIVANEDILPDISWFNYVRTSLATQYLVSYFSKKENLRKLL